MSVDVHNFKQNYRWQQYSLLLLGVWLQHAIVRGMMDENNEQFVAYFLPTQETVEKRRDDKENDVLYKPEEE